MKIIGKIFLAVAIIGGVLALCFIAFLGYQIYNDTKRPPTPTELAAVAYEARHGKNINQPFEVDSIGYNVTGFKYYPKKDTTFLFVDITIANKTNHTKNYTDSFFILKEGAYRNYYPTLQNYAVFENKKQPLKLQYILPKREFSFLQYDLHIISQKDTAQNGMVRFFWRYKTGG